MRATRHHRAGFTLVEVLLALLNDILDHSQLEAGRLAIESGEFDLHDLCRRIVAGLSADAQQRGLALQALHHELAGAEHPR